MAFIELEVAVSYDFNKSMDKLVTTELTTHAKNLLDIEIIPPPDAGVYRLIGISVDLLSERQRTFNGMEEVSKYFGFRPISPWFSALIPNEHGILIGHPPIIENGIPFVIGRTKRKSGLIISTHYAYGEKKLVRGDIFYFGNK